MIPVEFSTALFVESAEQRRAIPQQPAAPLGPRAVAPRRRPPRVFALADPRRSVGVAPGPRAAPALAPLPAPPGRDPGRLGRPDRPRRQRDVRARAAPSQPGGAEPAAERPDRRGAPPLAGRGPTLSAAPAGGVLVAFCSRFLKNDGTTAYKR